MGVYIDVEMPKENDELRLIIRSNGQVIISHITYYEEAEAIPVPEPHGRLIDEENICDKLRPLIENPYCYNRLQIISETLTHCLQIISDAPTVIPAEEGE